MRILILLSTFVLISQCKSVNHGQKSSATKSISITKGACYGTCPAYTAVIYESGRAEYSCQKFCDKEGIQVKQLEKKAIRTLFKAFDDAHFHEFKDVYESNIMDAPTVTISYFDGEKRKRVKGRYSFPKEVTQLQEMVSNLVEGTKGWTKIKDTAPGEIKAQPQNIYDEIIIEPKDPKLLSNWLGKYENYRLKVLDFAPDGQKLILKYDMAKVKPMVILAEFRKDPFVISAEFNKTKIK